MLEVSFELSNELLFISKELLFKKELSSSSSLPFIIDTEDLFKAAPFLRSAMRFSVFFALMIILSRAYSKPLYDSPKPALLDWSLPIDKNILDSMFFYSIKGMTLNFMVKKLKVAWLISFFYVADILDF